LKEADFKKCQKVASTIKSSPFGIVDASAMKVSEIGRIVRNNVKTRGVKVVIIDYIQIIRHDGKAERRTEQVAEISKELKHFAKRYNVHICALAQVNRESAKENRPPKIHEIAESDQIEKDADLVMLLHRPKDESGINGAEGALFVAKQRDGGKGMIPLMFNEGLVRFEDVCLINDEDTPKCSSSGI
jgi:replicative DNA helicase